MALTPAQLDRGLNAKFQQALAQDIDARLMSTLMTVTSTGRQENYGWLENVGTLEEVIDEVAIDGVFKSNQTIVNKTYAKAISARQDDLRRRSGWRNHSTGLGFNGSRENVSSSFIDE